MEINFNSNGYGNVGMGRETLDVSHVSNVKTESHEAVSSTFDFKASVFNPLQNSEPVTDIPDALLSRDDDLGKLVNSVFNLSPPPMPIFE